MTNESSRSHGSRSAKCAFHVATLIGASALAIVSASASAQDASSGASESVAANNEAANDIVVTGSRIARRDFAADSPIVTVGAGALEARGDVTLEAKLNQLPQFVPGATAYANNIAGSGQATLNLRGLGPSRNLVLLDGQRLQPSSASLAIDINTLPAILIDNVEIISGGASAVYGSDAISGVVNFKLKRNFNGLQLDAQHSLTGKGDGATRDYSLLAGTKLFGGRGHLMVAGEYYQRDTVKTGSRDFYSRAFSQGGSNSASNTLPTGTYTPTASNLPNGAVVNSVFATYGAVGSAIPAATILGFNNDGSLFTDNNGIRNFRSGSAATGYSARGNVLYYDPNVEVDLLAPMTRYSGFARLDYEVSDNIDAYVQGSYTNYTTVNNGSGTLAQGNTALSVPVTNPFIPADLATILASRTQPNANFTVVKRFTDAGRRIVEHENDVYQITAGLRGRLPGMDLSWELFGSHGETIVHDRITGGAVTMTAARTLLNARDGGRSICEGGLNVFGNQPISADCINYLTAETDSRTRLTQDNIEGNVQGALFDLPAGEVRFAAGGNYRRQGYKFTADPLLIPNPPEVIGFNSAASSQGSTSVVEGYAELLVPLLADLPLIRKLELDAAYRYSHYNITGGVSAYKADINWEVARGLRLRGGYQRAVRAPNVGELFQGGLVNYSNLGSAPSGGDPCDVRSAYRTGANAAQVRSLCIAQGVPQNVIDTYSANYTQVPGTTTGSKALSPETADTYTIGAVIDSPFQGSALLRGMTLSVDYYNISIKDAIGTITGPTMVANCFNANGSNPNYAQSSVYCQNIVRNADGTIFNLNQPYLNLGGYKTSGIDAQFDWRIPLEAVGFGGNPGDLLLNVVVNKLETFKIQNLPGAAYIDLAGTIGSGNTYVPWRVNTTLTYQADDWSLGVRWRHLSALRDYTSITTPSAVLPGVGAYNTVDLFGRVAVTDGFELRGGIDNLTDREPPVVGGRLGNTDAGTYDPLGRRFYIAARAKF
ncbi:TonB-dependent receptor domain-containing protein [Novosphingobium sp.]|uniref:TonB-dependent receptor domain-containing protein n=1 Tax=Novosphingobium sp. TaxID=1874826 RepID=UPI0028AB9C41|nr:TonB-dependent receptor [Novosphingobium sp.]